VFVRSFYVLVFSGFMKQSRGSLFCILFGEFEYTCFGASTVQLPRW
jgi:hypothetical protein